jgi:small-conductance mechanosensitive channel
MSDDQSTGATAEGALQFDRAEPTQGAAEWSCAMCGNPLVHQYYDANGKSLCDACRLRLETALSAKPGPKGFFKALAAGVGAGVLGAVIYYAVRATTGYELSLIAILVGWLVGKAVRWGTGGRGGRAYQVLAVVLTYMSIVSSYIPMIFQQFEKQSAKSSAAAAPANPSGTATPAGTAAPAKPSDSIPMSPGRFLLGCLLILGFAAIIPFLGGVQNILGIVIIAIGVWQAWKINQRPALTIAGPFAIRDRPAATPEPT